MENFCLQFRWLNILMAATILFTVCQKKGFSQQAPSHQKEGIVRIKVSEALGTRLDEKKFSRTLTGEVMTGIPSLDQINTKYKVKRFTRMFRHAGRNEARHRKHGLHLWYEVNIKEGSSVSQAVKSYRSDRQILKAEPVYQKAINGSMHKNFGPLITDPELSVPILPNASNDPMLGSQWHYHNTGQTGGKPGADIRLFDAWKLETGSKNVIVAVTDGGIQTNHPDLAANMWVNEGEVAGNRLDDDNNGYVDDIHGYSFVDNSGTIEPHHHGTHVGGTIAAVNNNGIGVAGVAGGSGNGDGIRLMSCAVFNNETSDGFPESYVYAADHGAVISQNSWGYTFPGIYEEAVLEAIDYFIAEAGKDENGNQTGPMNGGIVIFAAGNDHSDSNYYPGFYEPVLAVASSTHQDVKAHYSNFGSWVDITAPGGETNQAKQQGVLSTLANSQYGTFMGTSMACPHISGVAGLIVSKFGKAGFSPDALRERLRHSVNNIDGINSAYVGKLGSGRVNAALALSQNDQTAPQPVNDLSVAGVDIGEITLTWTSPHDESGFVSRYDIRYSPSLITASNFSRATAAPDVPAPKPGGTAETFTVKGLPGGTLFYFAIKSIDFEGNVSPISNVVNETSALTPAIVVSTASITENLKTAETSTRTFTISNTGEGLLKFSLTDADENDFASASPDAGVISPGDHQVITISFDAKGLFAGTYQQDITIHHNDPEQNAVAISITLQVKNNNAPIASIKPVSIDFKGTQTGTSAHRPVTISNEGSDALIIHKVSSTNRVFGADFSENMHIGPFTDTVLNITFSPESKGLLRGEVSIHTNDPVNEILKVQVQGEGLNDPPIVVSPGSFDETLEKGTTITRTMVLHNNGSQDRTFRLEVKNTSLVRQPSSEVAGTRQTLMATPSDSMALRLMRMKEKHETRLAGKSAEVNALLKPVGSENSPALAKNNPGKKILASTEDILQYVTGFEDFSLGSISGQQNWFSTQGWTVSADNPDRGGKHFRGTSVASGTGEKFAVSPFVEYEENNIPRYTTTTMRLNLDNAKGVTWQVVTQDQYFVANRIRFNADGTIDSHVIDNDYESHWKRVPVVTPSGYFDLAIEYNNWGSDTSGFPTYHLFINNHHVLSGTGLGFGIAQVAIVSPMEVSGRTFDLDNFKIIGDEFFPHFVKPSPKQGIIPAGESVAVSLIFDASIMKFGSYQSGLVVHLDETDSLIVPAALSVIGEPSMVVHPDRYISMESFGEAPSDQRTLMNTGGRPIQFNFDFDLPGLTVEPKEGILAVRENLNITVKFEGPPGIYQEQIALRTDIKDRPMEEIFVNVVIFDTGAIFAAPTEVQFDIRAGEITTRKIQVRNDGENTVSFRAELPFLKPWISLDPAEATISDEPVDIIMTFDAREVSAGTKSSWINFYTNDMNRRYHRMDFTVNVLPGTAGGKILREVWTGISGNKVSSIPVETTSSSTSELTLFESPANTGDNYGTRIRGYVLAPHRGYYTFWIASNDHSELWLSLDDSPQNKQKIASVTGSTNARQWDKYATQKSGFIFLEADQKYYIEALHKEGVGTDNLAVGWQLPDETFERPIPGLRLIPYGLEETNEPPQVSLTTPAEGEVFLAPATIKIEADAADNDGSIVKVEFYNGTTKLGADISAPYAYSWKNVSPGNYFLIVKATDNSGATDTASVNVMVTEGPSCAEAGRIIREQWNKISGTLISSIPLDTKPSFTETLSVFESPSNIGDSYGTRIRGFLCAPASGQYTFWIASNDKSELWLSTDSNPANKVRIAYVSGYTNIRQWTKYITQQSSPVNLTAGQKYYIEALHKEGVGTDHVAVGWQLPEGTMERPIPGIRLLPFETSGNEPPLVTITSPTTGQTFSAPATVEISADASDNDGGVSKVEFYNGTVKIGEVTNSPYSFEWADVMAGTYSIIAIATDNEGASTTSAAVSITVEAMCTASGTITREYWTGISGVQVSDIPVNTTPDGTEALTIFEGPMNAGSNYGARISGYLCPPATGDYYFWISSNDHSELWLSTDADPGKKIKIAFVTGATAIQEWNKFPSQRSGPVSLTQGKTCYIEALHKQGAGTDHVAVGWQLPDGTFERPINGNRLSPMNKSAAAMAGRQGSSFISKDITELGEPGIQVYPNPVKGERLTVTLGNLAQSESTIKDIEIRQLTGLRVYSQRVNCSEGCSTEINVNENFTPGVYILQVRVNGKTFTEKLIIP